MDREKRVNDAIALRKPDRVPIVIDFGAFTAQYAHITQEESMGDLGKHLEANWKTNTDLAPDLASPPLFLGPVLDALDCKTLKWAGHGLSADLPFQYVEGEYMKSEEYNDFLFDPSDFIIRVLWPRIFGKLHAFGTMPPLHTICNHVGGAFGFLSFGLPGSSETLEALRKAGEESFSQLKALMDHNRRLGEAGFPGAFAAVTFAPFDALGDFLRGTRGVMLDMYRRPDKVIAACEKLLPMKIREAVATARMSGNPRVFVPLHKGAEGFMSVDQFRRFYWPTLRELIVALVNEGLTPLVLAEGRYESRLDIIKDVPPGKIIYWFEDTEMVKARDALRERACVMGNVPASVLVTGTPEETKECCKRLIDTAGRNGGYIMSSAASPEDSKPENIRAMFEFTKEYGIY